MILLVRKEYVDSVLHLTPEQLQQEAETACIVYVHEAGLTDQVIEAILLQHPKENMIRVFPAQDNVVLSVIRQKVEIQSPEKLLQVAELSPVYNPTFYSGGKKHHKYNKQRYLWK